MGVLTINREITTSIPQVTMFNIFAPHDHVLHKSIPHVGVDTHEGDGGPGSIRKTTFSPHGGSGFKYIKKKVEAIDREKFTIGYSVIEGEPWPNTLEKATIVVKVEASSNGGSIIKNSIKYAPKPGCTLDQGQMNAIADQIMSFYKSIEKHI